jgi:hypothetical protein
MSLHQTNAVPLFLKNFTTHEVGKNKQERLITVYNFIMTQSLYLCGEPGQHSSKMAGKTWGKIVSLDHHMQTGFGAQYIVFYQIGTSSSSCSRQVMEHLHLDSNCMALTHLSVTSNLSATLTYIFLLLNTSAEFWFSWVICTMHLCVVQ